MYFVVFGVVVHVEDDAADFVEGVAVHATGHEHDYDDEQPLGVGEHVYFPVADRSHRLDRPVQAGDVAREHVVFDEKNVRFGVEFLKDLMVKLLDWRWRRFRRSGGSGRNRRSSGRW